MPDTLGTYKARTRRLLHDASGAYFTDADLTVDINDAIAERDRWSGGSRSYQANKSLTIGVDAYSLKTLFPSLVVLDVINLILVYGATRVTLQNPAFTDLTTMGRSNTQFQNRPWGWARYGADQVYIVPAPATPYPTDWDLVTLSAILSDDATPDPLPFPYTIPVPYYAAYLAKINQRQYQEADVFLGYFQKAIRDIDGARVGEMVSAYDQRGGRR